MIATIAVIAAIAEKKKVPARGRNKVYRIRDQHQKMGWDQGSQHQDLGSQAVEIGISITVRGSEIRLSDRTTKTTTF